ncbi:MAG: leucine-rich repeat domain-containing protein [Clostridia bacterium]|nr:leucine-rich repeat domain-containing protein [Clostridia bacterium]
MTRSRRVTLLLVLALTCGILLAVAPLQVGAAEEGCYVYTVSNGEATITGYTGSEPGVSIPSSIAGYPVTAIGNGAFRGANFSNLTIPNSVTTIGDGAFASCINLQMISIPPSVTSLGDGAFEDCIGASTIDVQSGLATLNGAFDGCINVQILDLSETNIIRIDAGSVFLNLVDVYLPASLTELNAGWFKENYKLWNISIDNGNSKYSVKEDCVISADGTLVMATTRVSGIPEGVSAIGAYAFSNRAGFNEVTIPAEITKIDANAFAGCSRLTDIYCEVASKPNGWDDDWLGDCGATVHWLEDYSDYTYEISNDEVTITGYNGQGGDVVIPETIEGYPVTAIGSNAFSGNKLLISVEIPEGVISIGDYAFKNCVELESINIPAGVTGIGEYAFNSCQSLTEITLPDNLTTIKAYTFASCYSLSRVNLPKNITNIGHYAFWFCKSLSSIDFPKSLSSIGVYAFSSCPLTALELPDSVISIGSDAFSDCGSLETVTLSKSLTSIESYLFYGCTSLNNIEIPDNVTKIDINAFGKCTSLETIALPAKLSKLGNYAFNKCVSLKSISIPECAKTVGINVFSDCDALKDVYCAVSSLPGGWNENWLGNCTATVHWTIAIDPNLVFSGASITLFDDLTVNFKADAALFETYTHPYVVFVQNGIETTVTEYAVEDGYYVFAFADILPNQMNDEITATMYATLDGTVYMSEAKAYSVATYCYNMLDKYSDDEKLRTLLVDILNYGAATQEYTDYNTANLANAGLTAAQKAWASPDRAFVSVENVKHAEIASPAVAWIGAGLNLSESIAVRYEFTTASTDGLTAKVACGGKTWEIAEFSKNEQDKDVLLVYINAGYMNEPIYVTLYDGETAVSDTVCYSIESYASTYGEDAELGALVKAMMKYGDAASAYITKG